MSKAKSKKKEPTLAEQYLQQIDYWGVEAQGATLHINEVFYLPSDLIQKPITIDIETDEQDNFVGLALTANGTDIFYITEKDKYLLDSFKHYNFVGHNLKGDLKWLRGWGIDIKPEQLYYDTMLASYVQNTTKKTHGLKALAKEHLDMEWPSYKEIVGPKKSAKTLDKQPVELVANYCGCDCLATYRLWEHYKNSLTEAQTKYLNEIEIPTSRVLMEMELQGVAVDVPYLEKIDKEFENKITQLKEKIKDVWFVVRGEDNKVDKELNVNSNNQIADLIESYGVKLPTTPKGNRQVNKPTLESLNPRPPVVDLLLEYSKIEKLRGTYTQGLLKSHKDGIIYTNFNQVTRNHKGESKGISTGRLSSSKPVNLQNIPTKTDEGKMILKAFVPRSKDLIFAELDFSQIEPRLVAHITGDKTFTKAFKDGTDIYSELVEGTGRTRNDGKTFMLALLYGAQAKKLASVFKCSESESEAIIKRIMSKLPAVEAWIERVKVKARQDRGVSTLWGRFIPLPDINSSNKWTRMHWERVAVNSIIQGSAAEIMKKSLIALYNAGYTPVLTVHDSFMIELNKKEGFEGITLQNHIDLIKEILENVVELDVPLKVSVGVGESWLKCKESETK